MHRKAVWLPAGLAITVVFLAVKRASPGVAIQLTGVIGAIVRTGGR